MDLSTGMSKLIKVLRLFETDVSHRVRGSVLFALHGEMSFCAELPESWYVESACVNSIASLYRMFDALARAKALIAFTHSQEACLAEILYILLHSAHELKNFAQSSLSAP